jgi:hypothetical protein
MTRNITRSAEMSLRLPPNVKDKPQACQDLNHGKPMARGTSRSSGTKPHPEIVRAKARGLMSFTPPAQMKIPSRTSRVARYSQGEQKSARFRGDMAKSV